MTSYGTVDQLQERINLEGPLTLEQRVAIEEILEAISRKIDRFCRRNLNFAAPAELGVKYFDGKGEMWLLIPECIAISQVAVRPTKYDSYEVWTAASSPGSGDGEWYPAAGSKDYPDYNSLPYTLLLSVEDPFTSGSGSVQVTATWGFEDDIVADIEEACLAQSAVLFKRYQGAMAATLGNFDLTTLSLSLRQKALSRDVQELLIDSGWVLPLYATR